MDQRYKHYFLPHVELSRLLAAVRQRGYGVVGPQVSQGAIVYEALTSVDQLPQGYQDTQSPGVYRLEKTASTSYFAWANGAQALKPLTFAPRETLWRAERDAAGKLVFNEVVAKSAKTAVLGVRACDIAALQKQDRIFLHDQYRDDNYAARRQALFLMAVNCNQPAAACFCVATGDGPSAQQGFDMVLTELVTGFIIQAGSDEGEQVLTELNLVAPSDAQFFEAGNLALAAEQKQRRHIDQNKIQQHLMQRLEHAQWDDIAERCLSCGNCTMVCPTCFCHREQDESNLAGSEVLHNREWDSCFTQGHSYIHGTTVRQQTKLRYRQWLTHKFATWVEQFGSSGCVGCGRCITWCPAGIDVTRELAVLCEGGEQ